MNETEVATGQTWRRKGHPGREVYIGRIEGDHAHVTRNTSRRRQAIALTTLRRDYYPAGAA
jgi:hypothetical protein